MKIQMKSTAVVRKNRGYQIVLDRLDELKTNGNVDTDQLFKVVFGAERVIGGYPAFVDQPTKDAQFAVVNAIFDDEGNRIDSRTNADLFERLIKRGGKVTITGKDETDKYILADFEATIPTTEERCDEIVEKTIADVSPELQGILRKIIADSIDTEENINEKLTYLASIGALYDEDLMIDVFSGYRSYQKPARKPSTVYQDPYEHKLSESIVTEGLRKGAYRIATLLEGGKSVGKNVYVETIAWLLNMPLRLITFSRSMSPSAIYGEKTTDNSASNALHTNKAYHFAKSKLMVECGSKDETDIDQAVRFELLKAMSASTNIIIDQSELYDWLVDGGVLVFNEMNMADANFFASFTNQLLDGTGFLFIPGRGEVEINPDCVLFGTQNAEYEGCEQQNEATMSRFCCIQFAQPGGVFAQLKAATEAALRKIHAEDRMPEDDAFHQAEKFYQACKLQHDGMNESGDYYDSDSAISDACLNIRGMVRALTTFARSKGHAPLKRQLEMEIVNTCPAADRPVIRASLDAVVTM